jgi:hypothetical protein
MYLAEFGTRQLVAIRGQVAHLPAALARCAANSNCG